jgi:MbtH protein
MEQQEDTTIYQVIMNDEEQYSIWPAHRELPLGWNQVGKVGTKAECLAYIQEIWTDMRPLSLRKKMNGEVDAE